MELIGSLFLVLALLLVVALFVARPFLQPGQMEMTAGVITEEQEREHHRSSLLADRDRVLTSLQELEFDYTLGKIPAEDYPEQRMALLQRGAAILRELDAMQPETASLAEAEERIEAAVAARRADAVHGSALSGSILGNVGVVGAERRVNHAKDDIEDLIATRRRQRQEKSAGFCPKCGRPVKKSDKFCSRCGATL